MRSATWCHASSSATPAGIENDEPTSAARTTPGGFARARSSSRRPAEFVRSGASLNQASSPGASSYEISGLAAARIKPDTHRSCTLSMRA